MSPDLWIVGKAILLAEPSEDTLRVPWEFVGVFDDKKRAVAACRHDDYFVGGPVHMNEALPDETVAFQRCWYPRLEEEDDGTARSHWAVEQMRQQEATP